MEQPLQPLSIESFSGSWLRSSAAAVPSSDASFIEMDPRLMSLRWTSDNFRFSLPTSADLATADDVISDGLLLPLRLPTETAGRKLDKQEHQPRSPDSVLSRSLSVDSSRVALLSMTRDLRTMSSPCFQTAVPRRPMSLNASPLLLRLSPEEGDRSARGSKVPPLLGSCGRSSKRIIRKYLYFLLPLYRKVRGLKLGGKAAAAAGAGGQPVMRMASGRRRRDSFTGVDCYRPSRVGIDVGVEKSIHEAVLHCKKSIGKED